MVLPQLWLDRQSGVAEPNDVRTRTSRCLAILQRIELQKRLEGHNGEQRSCKKGSSLLSKEHVCSEVLACPHGVMTSWTLACFAGCVNTVRSSQGLVAAR